MDPRLPADFVPDGGGAGPPVELFRRDAPLPLVCDDVTPPEATEVTVSVRTSPAGGRFAPRNVGAIWIERPGGVFVRTLAQWGQVRRRYLTAFLAASRGDVVDAVTGATLRSHQVHEVRWDLRDARRCAVGAGSFVLALELTDRNGAGPVLRVPFELARGVRVTAEDAVFHELELTAR